MARSLSLADFVRATADGRLFAVGFIRRADGAVRRMVCRRGVTAGATGKGMAYDPWARGLVPVYDVAARGFRCFPLDGLLWANFGGRRYVVSRGRLRPATARSPPDARIGFLRCAPTARRRMLGM